MLFYAALTVAGVVAAALLVWLLRTLTVAGRSAYRTLSPPGRANQQVKLAHLNSSLAATPAPWGWGGGKGTPAASRYDRQQFRREPVGPTRTKDFSEREAFERSFEKMKAERDNTSPHVGSVRNVLTGYDMRRSQELDTSSWPYRDSLSAESSAIPIERKSEAEADRPTKPWGW
jgi:hypothetical protein